ncbi:MAG: hypothetical protein J0L97_03145 [Alphaproteobacteria bacterium]|nr:hypothetical protein [Alphaproteobacteria bacterium]
MQDIRLFIAENESLLIARLAMERLEEFGIHHWAVPLVAGAECTVLYSGCGQIAKIENVPEEGASCDLVLGESAAVLLEGTGRQLGFYGFLDRSNLSRLDTEVARYQAWARGYDFWDWRAPPSNPHELGKNLGKVPEGFPHAGLLYLYDRGAIRRERVQSWETPVPFGLDGLRSLDDYIAYRVDQWGDDGRPAALSKAEITALAAATCYRPDASAIFPTGVLTEPVPLEKGSLFRA